ncbi:hypothetical protein TNCV_1262251 [Trichonephila clavipes]|nr:hypothetical protein TNCV_1262251 [Trichonephila clavipes]
MRTTNQHRAWGSKPRLVDEDRSNSSRWEDDNPDERSGQRMRDLKCGSRVEEIFTYANFPHVGENKSGGQVVIVGHRVNCRVR